MAVCRRDCRAAPHFLGYSKGAPDILEVAAYPEILTARAAVVWPAGAVDLTARERRTI
jgi:hypothetical protein